MVKNQKKTGSADSFSLDAAAQLQDKIARCLDENPSARERKRLECLRRVLAGTTCVAVAKDEGLDPKTVRRWLHKVKNIGDPLYKKRIYPPTDEAKKLAGKGITPDEVMAACTAETRVWARQRLQAVADVLAGHNCMSAARHAGTTGASVAHWLAIANRWGWRALIRQQRIRHEPFEVGSLSRFAGDLRKRLANNAITYHERTRLQAVLQILGGDDIDILAQDKSLSPATVRMWLSKLRRGGPAALFAMRPVRKPRFKDDPATLRACADQEKDRRIKQGLRALAYLAEGRSAQDAGIRAGVSPRSVTTWAAAYRKDGIEGLRLARQTRASKLTPQQKDELAAFIKAKPRLSRTELLSAVRACFGVDYTMQGLMRMVREDLNFRPRA